MKKSNPNQFINHSVIHHIAEKLKQTIMLKSIVLLLLMLFTFEGNAQRARVSDEDTPRFLETSTLLNQLKQRERSARTNSLSQASRLESLLRDLQSSIYYFSGEVKTYGDKPLCLFTDVRSLNSLSQVTDRINNVEIATIKISNQNDVALGIDLKNLSQFKNLKYIHILSDVPLNEVSVSKMIKNYDFVYTVFYSFENGDN